MLLKGRFVDVRVHAHRRAIEQQIGRHPMPGRPFDRAAFKALGQRQGLPCHAVGHHDVRAERGALGGELREMASARWELARLVLRYSGSLRMTKAKRPSALRHFATTQ
jgi:hypothetical protein